MHAHGRNMYKMLRVYGRKYVGGQHTHEGTNQTEKYATKGAPHGEDIQIYTRRGHNAWRENTHRGDIHTQRHTWRGYTYGKEVHVKVHTYCGAYTWMKEHTYTWAYTRRNIHTKETYIVLTV